jgi:hypothetical protein
MSPHRLLLLGGAGALVVACAAHLPFYEQSLELNTSGNDPWDAGGTRDRIAGVLAARGYTVQYFDMRAPNYAWYGSTRWTPWGIRLRTEGWDQIDVSGASAALANQTPPASYRWYARARTFGSDGTALPASAEARADVDSIMAQLSAVSASRLASGEAPAEPEWYRGGRCMGGVRLGAFTALPTWAGAPVTIADRIARSLEQGGWTVTQAFPAASPGALIARRTQLGGWDVVTVYSGGPEDRSGYGVRIRYSVRATFCDRAGRRGLARGEVRAEAETLVRSLREASAGAP